MITTEDQIRGLLGTSITDNVRFDKSVIRYVACILLYHWTEDIRLYYNILLSIFTRKELSSTRRIDYVVTQIIPTGNLTYFQ